MHFAKYAIFVVCKIYRNRIEPFIALYLHDLFSSDTFAKALLKKFCHENA